MKRLLSLTFVWFLCITSFASAYFLDAPHNEANLIACATCHNVTHTPDPNDPDDTWANYLCQGCHDNVTAPQMGNHTDQVVNNKPPGQGLWTNQCVDCHDPHFQGQLDWIRTDTTDLWLVQGFIPFQTNYLYEPGVGGVFGQTTITFAAGAKANNPLFSDPATWAAKGGFVNPSLAVDNNRGLLLVPGLADTSQVYEIVGATGSLADGGTITIKGQVPSTQVGPFSQFGIIYGQALKSYTSSIYGSMDIKFFSPFLSSGVTGFGDTSASTPPTGICQVCHPPVVAHWNTDNSGDGPTNHHATENCSTCHPHGDGFKPATITPVVSINAVPTSITLGDSTLLSWSVSNAETCLVEPGGYDCKNTSNQIVTPAAIGPITYTISAVSSTQTQAQTSVTVQVYAPPTVSMTADPTTIFAGGTTTLFWETTNASTVTIDGIGPVPPNGGIYIGLYATTTFTITATNQAGGTAVDSLTVDVLVADPLGVKINTPADNAIHNENTVNITGVFGSQAGEAGITVNGLPAQSSDNTFFVNNLPLTEGVNTITAVATDPAGNQSTDTIMVTVDTSQTSDTIFLSISPENGVASFALPLTAKLTATLSPSLDAKANSVTVYADGPATPGLVLTSFTECDITIDTPGVYTITYKITDFNNQNYSKEIRINVIDPLSLDLLLKSKWNGMKSELAAQNIGGGVGYFTGPAQAEYTEIFTTISPELPNLIANMQPIEVVYVQDRIAKYRIRRDQVINGQTYTISYYIYFVRDANGLWRIESF